MSPNDEDFDTKYKFDLKYLEQEDISKINMEIKDEEYRMNKPKRIIIKAEIIHD